MSCIVTTTSQSFVTPSQPTPASQTLELSVIDRVPGLRHLVRSLHVFKQGVEPARIIREALAKALVKYYPFAGRFVETERGEVGVACTNEGVWFVEAKANCKLVDVEYLDEPMMIHQDELLPKPTSDFDPINLPAMLQVTEFECGGFVVGLISVHTIADGLGAGQFMNAIAHAARNLTSTTPTTNPIWSRDLIPNPPKQLIPPQPPVFPSFKLHHCTIDIPSDLITATKFLYFTTTGQHCSAFDICTAKVWQARTRAINLDATADVHVCFFANTRHLLQNVLPPNCGFYGNCFYPVAATASVKDVVSGELVDVVRIIRDAKASLPTEFAKWAAGDFKEDPYELRFTYDSLFVSDWTRLGFLEVDYGWGTPANVVPFAYYDFMAVGIIGAPPVPKKGARLMTQCVEKEHLDAFLEEMKSK